MTGSRLRLLTILAIAAVAALTLLAATQQWWTITASGRALTVAGTVASPALSALALTGLVLAAALSIAGPVFRVVLGILQAVVGATIVLAAASSVARPVEAAASVITKATGVTGTSALEALVTRIAATAWPAFAIVFGVLAFLLGVLVILTFGRWPGPSRKYSAVRLTEPDAARDPVVDWDALSDGTDPTTRE